MDVLAIGLAVWAWSLSRRPGAPRWLAFAPWLLAFTFIGSMAGTLLGLRHAFASVAELPPEEKSAYLAKGISSAMTYTLIGLAVDVVMVVVLLVATIKLRSHPASQAVRNDAGDR